MTDDKQKQEILTEERIREIVREEIQEYLNATAFNELQAVNSWVTSLLEGLEHRETS